jgi:hypothetical protein
MLKARRQHQKTEKLLDAAAKQARDITGHTTEATAERIYDRRTAKRGKAVE